MWKKKLLFCFVLLILSFYVWALGPVYYINQDQFQNLETTLMNQRISILNLEKQLKVAKEQLISYQEKSTSLEKQLQTKTESINNTLMKIETLESKLNRAYWELKVLQMKLKIQTEQGLESLNRLKAKNLIDNILIGAGCFILGGAVVYVASELNK